MARALVACFTIVAAFQLPAAAAAPLYEDLLVPPAVLAASRAIGLDPTTDAATFLSDVVRILYGPMRNQAADALAHALLQPITAGNVDDSGTRVPVPLTAAIWNAQVLERPVDAGDLFRTIVSDRRTALLAYGLAGLDEATLAFLAEQPGWLPALDNVSAASLAAFGETLRVEDGRLVVPGGREAAPLWEAVVGESPDRPAAFVRLLLEQQRGRIAYLFDLIGSLDPERAAFALGSWMDDSRVRAGRFAALASAAVTAFDEWNVQEQPFARPLNDLSMLLMRLRVDDRGVPHDPRSRTFWSAAFGTDDPRAPAPAFGGTEDGVIDAAWLAQLTSFHNPYARSDRLDQLSFGQRVFSEAAPGDLENVLAAVRGFRSHRTLLLTMERMGIRSPSVFAEAVRQVSEVTGRDASRVFWPLVQLQGALAILTRTTTAGTIDVDDAERLVLSLTRVPLQGDRDAGGIGEWIERELLPVLPSSLRPEGRILAGLAGPSDRRGPTVRWEGQDYRLDFAAAELERLRLVREKQGGYTVDLALALLDVARPLVRRQDADGLREASVTLTTLLLEFARELGRSAPDIMAAGVRRPADARRVMAMAASELTTAAARADAATARRVAGQLTDLADLVLGEALLSLTYAVHLGDPNGTALLGRNVAMRHDFGLSHPESGTRARNPWTLPRQNFRPGVAWHVTGSLLGLDIALAPLGLRRFSSELPPDAPTLMSIEREAFAVSLALLDPLRLRDADRDAIATAIARGRERVAGLMAEGDAAVDAVIRDLALLPRRRHALRWTLARAPAARTSFFALTELLVLGGVPRGDLDAWGMGALATEGCPCTRLVPSSRWRLFEGRPQVGLLSALLSDLNLHVALTLHDLAVPAPLAKPVLAAAVLEFVERVSPMHINDWRTLSRAAQAIPRERIEDYVAAAAAVGGPLVPVESEQRP